MARTAGPRAEGDEDARLKSRADAERRLLQAVFQQVPVPLFLLALDGTVRRANAAAGRLMGSGLGYPTGKRFTLLVDPPSRPAVQAQIADVIRTGEARTLRCGMLTAAGVTECEVTASPLEIRGDTGQLALAVTEPSGRAGPPAAAPTGDAQDALRIVIRRLDLVTSATRILLDGVGHSEPVTLQRFARLLARELAAWLIVDVERDGRLRRQLALGPDDQLSDELARSVAAADPPAGSVPAQVYRASRSLLVAHADDPDVLGVAADGEPLLPRLGASSVLCVPLSDGERCHGVLTLARPAGGGPFGVADVGVVEELGEQLALTIRANRMLRHRAEVADALQASMLPRQPRHVPGAEVAAGHVPAASAGDTAGDTGGDFYDTYPALDGWGLSIGDVCGRGQDAAAVTAIARHAIRVLARSESDPAEVLRRANEILMEEEFGGRFVTASVGHLRWHDGSLHVVVGSAGHPWPMLVRADGRTQVLQGGGLPLGVFADAEPATQEIGLDPGDLLFFFSDGLTSARGPDPAYVEDRVTDELAGLAGQPAAQVVARMQEVVARFGDGQLRDDVTMLALRAVEPPADKP